MSVALRESGPAVPTGLSEAEAAARLAAGLGNRAGGRVSRTFGEIVRANVFTRFNALLGSLLVVVLVIGPLQDAFFGLILVANTAIGIVQELRAKLTLDRLALLRAPTATVIRDGRERRIAATEVVPDDVLVLAEGDEVVADAAVVRSDGLEVDEALLTGESAAVPKPVGAEVLGGSFAVAGSALGLVRRVGDDSFAGRLTREAKHFQLVRSDLMVGINRILRIVTWLLPPMAALLLVTQLRSTSSITDGLRGSIAGLVTLVPEGLVLLTSVSLAVAIVRLGRRGVLVQQLAAVEMLARADLVCLDKTGTLTDGTLRLERVEALDPGVDAALPLAAMLALDPAGELQSVARELPAPPAWQLLERVPFSSARRWASARFAESGAWVLGAPDALLAAGCPAVVRAEQIAAQGSRVLLFARPAGGSAQAPEPVALLVLREGLRENVWPVLQRLRDEAVQVAVLSGDHPATVRAVAASLGIDGDVHGRVSPDEKARIVRGYQTAGHVVAMVGDGVNDVLALKAADIGLAVGGGSTAARAVAAVAMLDADFDAVPAVIAEGRRVIANVERLASLFVTKTAYAALLGIGAAVWMLPFPFLPRNLTLISAFTIGIPAFFLALAPSAERARPGFLPRVARFALPVGLVAAAFTFAGYYLALDDPRVQLDEARTAATMVLAGLGIWVLTLLARPLTGPRRLLIGAMGAALAICLTVPATQALFGIDIPHPLVWLAAIALVVIGGLCLEGGLWLSGWAGRLSARRRPGAG